MAEKKKNAQAFDIKRDSFVYRLCFSVCKWFLVSILFYICSIPVFTAGTALCAVLAVSREECLDIRDIISGYFSAFSAYFKKTVPVFLIFLPVMIGFFCSLTFYHQFFDAGTVPYYLMTGIMIFLILAAVSVFRFYCYEVTLGELISFRQRFSRALVRMMRCLPIVGILILLDIGLIATVAGAPIALPVLFAYPGFHAFLTCLSISRAEKQGNTKQDQ